jgi:hypothetical protein
MLACVDEEVVDGSGEGRRVGASVGEAELAGDRAGCESQLLLEAEDLKGREAKL